MERDIHGAAVSMACPGNADDIVLERLEGHVRSLSARGVEVVCFPEACLTGYSLGPEARQWARPLDDPVVRSVQGLAAAHGVWILAGLMEAGQEGRLHISHLAISPAGEMAVYRKAHLSPQEKRIFSPGARPGLFHLNGTPAAMALCFEAHFPEWIARLGVSGAEILFFPHASPHEAPGEKRDRWLRYLPARAYDNSAYALACNQAGSNGKGLVFPAVALILDPKGRTLAAAQGGQEAVAVALLEAREINRVRSHPVAFFLGQRRPELYWDRNQSGRTRLKTQ
jgi:N-carbamoylputrescine amidase